MVNHSGGAALDATFQALADPTRRAILAKLVSAPETSVSELASPFRMSLPAVSRHLRVLESAGLLARRREGRVHHCRFVPGPMRTAGDWIAHYQAFWENRLDALKRYLENPADDVPEAKEEKPWPNLESKPLRRRPRRRPHPQDKPSASRARSGRRVTGSTGRGRTRSS